MKQFIPARGRKRGYETDGTPADETIHPRKGTETLTMLCIVSTLFETIHPRKGTETATIQRFYIHNGETIHPRKGTETGQSYWELRRARKQFIPARGRKRFRLCKCCKLRHETIHPRKGTET